MAKRVKEPEPETGIVKAVDPLVDAPAEVNPSTEPSPAVTGPTFGQQVGRFFRFLFRLVLVLILLAAIGVGLYFGLPLLYQRYVVPVERSTAGMVELQSRQEQTEQELTALQSKFETLESGQAQNTQALVQLEERVGEIETEIAARTKSLAALEEIQAELQAQNEAASAELERQISLLKSMELLSRARLFMYQSNFGLARQDVQIARDLLGTMRPDAPETLAGELDEVLLRLDLTLSNLPNFPVAASDDLDIAWQVLLSGLPEATPTITATPTPVDAASPTPSAADMTITPTAQMTVQPSATP
ncbi:MAG TPA: hypothetical protein VK897_23870 [Anaerolineales bacterium]|nr:hypothetical protein [Anaerolineales bacterium]